MAILVCTLDLEPDLVLVMAVYDHLVAWNYANKPNYGLIKGHKGPGYAPLSIYRGGVHRKCDLLGINGSFIQHRG